MYTKRVQLINYGPVETLDIGCPFEGDTPKPVVLVGTNGSGKSILLSHIVSGLVRAKDIVYPETPEVEPGRAYKFKTNFYIKVGSFRNRRTDPPAARMRLPSIGSARPSACRASAQYGAASALVPVMGLDDTPSCPCFVILITEPPRAFRRLFELSLAIWGEPSCDR